MVLVAYETSLGRQTDATEIRDAPHCAECDPDKVFWQIRDALIKQQSELKLSIANFVKNAKPVSI